jgi:hypothetical protein
LMWADCAIYSMTTLALAHVNASPAASKSLI